MDNIAEQLLHITVRLEGRTSRGTSVGTGFLFRHDERLFVVTNKHVVAGVTDGTFILRRGSLHDGKRTLFPKAGVEIHFSETSFIGHPSADVDVTAMNISRTVNELEKDGTLLYWKEISAATAPSSADVEKFVSPIEEILFIGYPSGLWDFSNLSPIARKGITATPYYVPFMGEPKFLIDASVFPGSSGSPVFLYYAGAYPDKAGNLYAGSRAFFLGILAQVFQRTEEGAIQLREAPTAQLPVVEVRQMIDIGVVFNDKTVTECVAHFLAQANGQTKA